MLLLSLFGLLGQVQGAAYSQIYNLSQLTDASSRVLEGKVVGLQSRMENGKIYTRVSLEVNKTYVGARGKTVSFDVLGGKHNGLELSVSGAPQFDLGQSGLFFLDQNRVVGFGQGVFELDQGIAKRGFHTEIQKGPDNFAVSQHLPDEGIARDCLQSRIDALYADGWSLRNQSANHLADGELHSYPVTLMAGNEYKILACTDEHASDLELMLVERTGEIVEKETEQSREASLDMIAKETTNLFITTSGVSPEGTAARVGVSIAVLYR